MRTETVTCDGCGRDITVTGNIVDYRLALAAETMPGHGAGAYTAMGKYPAIERPHHFCNLACLDNWRDHERLFSKVLDEHWSEWRQKHGARVGERIVSYSSPPDDVLSGWKAESKDRADREFPLDRNATKSNE